MSNEAKHTPGPWHVEAEEWTNGQGIAICREGLGVIAVIDPGPAELRAEDEANARLIAAAPELKDALADLVFDLAAIGFDSEDSVSGADAVEVICQHWKTLKAAIAQATGKGQQ